MNHEKKTYVVTGASSGVGAALAAFLTKQGARIIAIDRAEPKAEMNKFINCDLTDPEQISAAVAAIDEPIDGLVNVAGVPSNMSVDMIAKVNYLALRMLTDALLPKIKDFGAVVNVASAAGAYWRKRTDVLNSLMKSASWDDALKIFQDQGYNSVVAYSVTKEAAIYYTMMVSSQERHRGIRVNSVSPGAVQTPILKDFYGSMDVNSLDRLRIHAGGRDGLAEEMCGPIGFLLGQDSRWVNGTDLLVDGGAEVTFHLGDLIRPAKQLSF
ncbi:coniferyl-alcohol dehydrogenase [Mesorhizobium kowhaii]|uniref:coniferyl-alcohol dehydrogenase n=1 Tax=Mesorhizobium kowhaii TaxID=1300272 RepID=UPI0035F0C656